MKRELKIIYLLAACLLYNSHYTFCSHPDGNGIYRDQTNEDSSLSKREVMVQLLRAYNIKDLGVLGAMKQVRRHLYIPGEYRWRCNPYGDHPCPIGHGQTISQPYIVAYMTERMELKRGEKVLEIGTGSGYQAAVLAELGTRVYTVEVIKELAAHAKEVLKAEGYKNVQSLRGDGYNGWPEFAPYDAIIVTCSPNKVPKKLVEQLREGGRMILPVGEFRQRLVILRKKDGKIIKENDLAVRFVPMVHEKNQK